MNRHMIIRGGKLRTIFSRQKKKHEMTNITNEEYTGETSNNNNHTGNNSSNTEAIANQKNRAAELEEIQSFAQDKDL